MHWSDVHAFNVAIVDRLADGGCEYATEEDLRDVRYVLERWSFPMTSLDLTLAEVQVDDLKRQRERWLAHEMGLPDELTGDYGAHR